MIERTDDVQPQDGIDSDKSVSEETNEKPQGIPNSGRFWDTDRIFETLTSSTDFLSEIPFGIKENVVFICDNTRNIKKRLNCGRSKFVDDCGVWGQGSTKKHYFWKRDGKMEYMDKFKDQYCKMEKGKRVAIASQPPEAEIVILKKYYVRLKRCPDYQKRITWLEKSSADSVPVHPHLAVYEYRGNFPQMASVHGNSTKSSSEFIRTPASTMDSMREDVKHQHPRDVYSQHCDHPGYNKPRDLKQLQNLRQDTRGDPTQNRQNGADDVLALLNDINCNDFIQEVTQTKGKPPCVILYTKDQLFELKQFCSRESKTPLVVGVDRTFNLGACYVTLLVFQHPNLLRKGSNVHPIMLGPLYLHWDGAFDTYHRSFSHVRSVVDNNLGGTQARGNVAFGSDEEKALTKALQICFPDAIHVLCKRHIQQNIKRFLRQTVGANDKEVNHINNLIFGSSGLINSVDTCEFDLRQIYLEDYVASKVPNFSAYLCKALPTIKNKVFLPGKKITSSATPLHWTNNACESMNHIIKLSTNWKSLKLPDLVEKLRTIVKIQYSDMRRALYGQGNYELTAAMRSLRITHACWVSKTDREQDHHFNKLLQGKPKRRNIVISSDGRFQMPITSRTAKKPGQRKRLKNSKTVTT